MHGYAPDRNSASYKLYNLKMKAKSLSILACLTKFACAANVRSLTPPLGWNTYNKYACTPTEDIVKSNANGLVDLGFLKLGYKDVFIDCGWPIKDRDSQGRMQWNTTLFPSGPDALGDYLHKLGLSFGVYSGGGYFQCGSTDQPASLGETNLCSSRN